MFVDTPGIHKAKNKLGEYMVHVAERTLNEVDVVPVSYTHLGIPEEILRDDRWI